MKSVMDFFVGIVSVSISLTIYRDFSNAVTVSKNLKEKHKHCEVGNGLIKCFCNEICLNLNKVLF
jgi:hypothetical protein